LLFFILSICICLYIIMLFVLSCRCSLLLHFFFFFNDTATTEIYTLSLHDALPILRPFRYAHVFGGVDVVVPIPGPTSIDLSTSGDRKSRRLNSSHRTISYAVFCLKKKKQTRSNTTTTESPRSYKPLTLSIPQPTTH